jgi:hypothetical protein
LLNGVVAYNLLDNILYFLPPISIRPQTIAAYMATHTIFHECRQGKQKRGAVPHCWWWEQPIDLDTNNLLASGE